MRRCDGARANRPMLEARCDLFYGQHERTIDAKWRLAVPAERQQYVDEGVIPVGFDWVRNPIPVISGAHTGCAAAAHGAAADDGTRQKLLHRLVHDDPWPMGQCSCRGVGWIFRGQEGHGDGDCTD